MRRPRNELINSKPYRASIVEIELVVFENNELLRQSPIELSHLSKAGPISDRDMCVQNLNSISTSLTLDTESLILLDGNQALSSSGSPTQCAISSENEKILMDCTSKDLSSVKKLEDEMPNSSNKNPLSNNDQDKVYDAQCDCIIFRTESCVDNQYFPSRVDPYIFESIESKIWDNINDMVKDTFEELNEDFSENSFVYHNEFNPNRTSSKTYQRRARKEPVSQLYGKMVADVAPREIRSESAFQGSNEQQELHIPKKKTDYSDLSFTLANRWTSTDF